MAPFLNSGLAPTTGLDGGSGQCRLNFQSLCHVLLDGFDDTHSSYLLITTSIDDGLNPPITQPEFIHEPRSGAAKAQALTAAGYISREKVRPITNRPIASGLLFGVALLEVKLLPTQNLDEFLKSINADNLTELVCHVRLDGSGYPQAPPAKLQHQRADLFLADRVNQRLKNFVFPI